MSKKMSDIQIIPACPDDYPIVQNLAQYYVYDRTKYMGWECSKEGLFECIDFKHYFTSLGEEAFLIKVEGEIAGFVLLDKEYILEPVDWNMGEFFIIAKFQGKQIAATVAHEIFKTHAGKWHVAVMPENVQADKFWRKVIAEVTGGDYKEVFKTAAELKTDENPDPYDMNVFTFEVRDNVSNVKEDISIRTTQKSDISSLVEMSYRKRLSYEKAQSQYWKYAGSNAENVQAKWFEELLLRDDHIMLTALGSNKIVGFIIGKLMHAPEVYNPGGLTLMIDDFCVLTEGGWPNVGSILIDEIKIIASTRGAAQILVVCGAHDEAKRRFLKNTGLTIASEWLVGDIG